jgi:hypothetical protein
MFGGSAWPRILSNIERRKKHRMTIADELIRERAYQLWLKAGSPTGQNRIHWARARAELERELSDVKQEHTGSGSLDEKASAPVFKTSESGSHKG